MTIVGKNEVSGFGRYRTEVPVMIIIGIVLAVIGYVITAPILWTIGIILILVGVVLWVLGSAGHAVGGRRHYY
ncbi:hypothetical protein GCM10023094_34150 [Rhodococcus olei]|uniref:Uncharacterized protein n=1 Tax=Rhodococcus olei TaxID=2161675 RepID=A0ABP8PAF2_9NOCA